MAGNERQRIHCDVLEALMRGWKVEPERSQSPRRALTGVSFTEASAGKNPHPHPPPLDTCMQHRLVDCTLAQLLGLAAPKDLMSSTQACS